jgi:hypothetical protein
MNIKNSYISIKYYLILTLIITAILVNKIYFLLINPAGIGSFTYAVNTMLFFNTKAVVEIAPQAFNDFNHPGTPIYLLGYLIEIIIGEISVKNIQIFLTIHHFLSTVYLIFALVFFFVKLKKKIDVKIILSTIFLIISFDNFFHQIEIVDIQNYLLPTYLILISYVLVLDKEKIYKKKNIIIISFLCSLLLSIKLNTIPIFIALYVGFLFFFLMEKKIKFFLKYIFYFILSFILINFPIIGRLPKIIFNTFFNRSDTIVETEIFEKFISKINLFNYNLGDYFVFFIYFVFIILFFFLAYKNLDKKNSLDIFFKIVPIFFIFFFLYTLFLTVSYYEIYDGRGIITRNSYLLFSFLIFEKSLWQEERDKKLKQFILLISSFLFLINNSHYISSQKKSLLDIEAKNNKFLEKYFQYFSKSDTIAIYNNGNYGFKNFCALSNANEAFVKNAFTDELIAAFPKKRHLNVNFISAILEDNETAKSKTREFYDLISEKFSENLPDKLNEFLNMKSYQVVHGKFNKYYFKNLAYIKKNEFETIDGFIFFDKQNKFNSIKIVNYLNQNNNYQITKIFIDDDMWWFLKLKK